MQQERSTSTHSGLQPWGEAASGQSVVETISRPPSRSNRASPSVTGREAVACHASLWGVGETQDGLDPVISVCAVYSNLKVV